MRKSEMWMPRPTKGAVATGQRLIMFDAVRDCRGHRCPIYDKCPYVKEGTCTVERTYLEAILRQLMDIPGRRMTQPFLNKVSLHLMPLFHQLIRFQIRAYGVEDVCYETNQGAIKVHPIFKEIRACIKSIEGTQKSLGVDLEYFDALGILRGPKAAAGVGDNPQFGDSSYLDDMQEDMQSDLFGEEGPVPEGGIKKSTRRFRTVKDDSQIDTPGTGT